MYITYRMKNGEAVSKHDTLRTVDPAHYCLMFLDLETRNAAWIADANMLQAIAWFGGIEVRLTTAMSTEMLN